MPLTKSIFGIYNPAHKLALLCADLLLLSLALYTAATYRLKTQPDFFSVEYIGLHLVVISCLFLGGAYTSKKISRRPKLPLNTFFVILASSLPSAVFIYILGPERYTALLGRGVYPIALVCFGFLSVFSHYFLNLVFYTPPNKNHVLLLGSESSCKSLQFSTLSQSLELRISSTSKLCDSEYPLEKLRAIVISPEYVSSSEEQRILLNYRLQGLPIYSLSDFYENFFFLVPVQEINNDWFIRSQGFAMLHNSIALKVKRLVDILSSSTLLFVSLPLCLLSAVLIKSNSKGSVFFLQKRVGIEGKIFTIYKFRTMHVDAEKKGAQWASDNDSRIIPCGNFLRKSRIDELPQCWNILKGDMSFIGPRPERPEFTSMLAQEIPYYDLRHVVKPGLTGWAQVSYPYGASVEDALKKLQYDLYYIKNYSLLLDFNILLRTVLVMIRRSGR